VYALDLGAVATIMKLVVDEYTCGEIDFAGEKI
jgi:hypothetical protein